MKTAGDRVPRPERPLDVLVVALIVEPLVALRAQDFRLNRLAHFESHWSRVTYSSGGGRRMRVVFVGRIFAEQAANSSQANWQHSANVVPISRATCM